ncbi:Uncharacterized protein dnm_095980 [Desulfonema magnum]|uniref:Uncharacterized protein n=1 Tax=Desulfonema magnum TaxID=45655 RepID=A0A975BXU4_9BACT|nr:Uncharacterized protein dnm_095980 [Desulfonema magnum]
MKNSDYNGFRGGPTKPCKGDIFVALIIEYNKQPDKEKGG